MNPLNYSYEPPRQRPARRQGGPNNIFRVQAQASGRLFDPERSCGHTPKLKRSDSPWAITLQT